ncbi:MAG TPA: ATP-binding cassette domain-containing protein, partial [Polyangia bacterium]
MSFDAVEARGLTKVYGRQRALAGVDLTLRAGESTALLGPNGAGKSTLVGILSTLLAPSEG